MKVWQKFFANREAAGTKKFEQKKEEVRK